MSKFLFLKKAVCQDWSKADLRKLFSVQNMLMWPTGSLKVKKENLVLDLFLGYSVTRLSRVTNRSVQILIFKRTSMSGLVSLRPEKIIFSAKYAYVAYRVTQSHKMESGIRLIFGIQRDSAQRSHQLKCPNFNF